MKTESRWWIQGHRGVVIRVARPHPDEAHLPLDKCKKPLVEKILKAKEEELQAVLDKAWQQFGDPTKVMSDPTPFFQPVTRKTHPAQRRGK